MTSDTGQIKSSLGARGDGQGIRHSLSHSHAPTKRDYNPSNEFAWQQKLPLLVRALQFLITAVEKLQDK